MRRAFIATLAVALASAAPAFAETSAKDAAVQLCRTTIAQQAGVDVSQVSLYKARVGNEAVNVQLDLRRGSRRTAVSCRVSTSPELAIASITPTIVASTSGRTATASN